MTSMIRHPRMILPGAVLFAACAGGSDGVEAQSAARDACELLPASVVEEVAGVALQAEDLGRTETWSACGYLDPTDGMPALEIQVTWSGGKEKAAEEVDPSLASMHPVDALGDGAWLSTYEGRRSLVLEGDVLVEFHLALLPDASLQMMQDNDALRERFETLARSVLSSL